MKYKRVLVTGTAGFIGFHLSERLLQEGVGVIGVDSLNDYYDVEVKNKRNEILKKNKNYHFYKTNIAEYEKLSKIIEKEKPEAIIHLAAQAGVRHSLVNPWIYAESNYLGTLNIFEVARRYNVKRVLFASSGAVYGNNTKMPFAIEDRTDTPISIYGATKKANELLAHSYHHLFGTEMGGMRFFTVYGQYGRPDLALFKFVRNILRDEPIDVYNKGKMTRTFTHVNDVVDGIIALLNKKDLKYEIYNFSGSDSITLSDFIDLIGKYVGKQAVKRFLPMQAGDIPVALVDISKAKKDLDYNPKVSIEAGVKDFVEWFMKNKDWLLKLKDS